MDAQTVALSEIVADPDLQPRVDGLDAGHVRELETGADYWAPISLVMRDSRFFLVDGFHRLQAAKNLRLKTIRANVLQVPGEADLHALAFELNASHGRPLSLKDRRSFAIRLLTQHPTWSDREVGRQSGLVQPTIAKIRGELEGRKQIPQSHCRVGRDGRSYRVAQPTATGRPHTLVEAIGDLFSPAERKAQRRLVRYMVQLAEQLENQEKVIASFDTIAKGAEACRAVLGAEEAKALGERLGWSSSNILELARNLRYREENPS